MKWLALLPTLFLIACHCVSTEVLESKQVVVAPEPKNKIVLLKDKDAIDVTNNTITCY